MSTLSQISIDGAMCRLKDGDLQFQPRNDAGETLWIRWYREKFYEGWNFDKEWSSEPLMLTIHGRPVDPEFTSEPIGWTVEQITKAKCWAGDLIATRAIAVRFAPKLAAE